MLQLENNNKSNYNDDKDSPWQFVFSLMVIIITPYTLNWNYSLV